MVRGIYRQFPKCSKCSLNQVIPIHNMNTIPVLEELHCLFQNSSTPDLFWIKAMNDAYLWYFRITWIKAIYRIKGRISLFSLFLKKRFKWHFLVFPPPLPLSSPVSHLLSPNYTFSISIIKETDIPRAFTKHSTSRWGRIELLPLHWVKAR